MWSHYIWLMIALVLISNQAKTFEYDTATTNIETQTPIENNIESYSTENPIYQDTEETSAQTETTTMNSETQQPDNYGWKSKAKCQYYSELRRSFNKNISNKCKSSVAKKIVRGTIAIPGEFPHMAKWGYLYSIDYRFCGANLISEQYLLTAAHCFRHSEGQLSAILGTDEAENQIIVNISERIDHPDYDYPKDYDDIALLRLQEPVNFTKFIWPACLTTDDDYKEKKVFTAIATGWGYTEHGWDTSHLRKVVLPLKNISECIEAYPPDNELFRGVDESSMVCAGGKNLTKDTCAGDSGGPLQIQSKKLSCMYCIIGITSFGKLDCGSNVAVYTKVSNYITWIESIVWPGEE